jgi:hypothetical protein
MATMSNNSLRLAFLVLAACALGGFYFGVTGAMPRGGGGDDLGDTVDASANGPPVNATAMSDASMGAAPSDEDSDAEASDTPAPVVKRTPRPAASSTAPTAPDVPVTPLDRPPSTPASPPPRQAAPAAPAPTPPPADQELPPY